VDLIVYDTVRVIVVVAALVALVLTPWAVRHAKAAGQRIRLSTMAAACVVISSIEIEHFGDDANWRLGVSVAVNIMTVWGLVTFLRREEPSTIAPDPQRVAELAASRPDRNGSAFG
jgi:hypothetical protein